MLLPHWLPLVFIQLSVLLAQDCLRPEGGGQLPPFDDDNSNPRIPDGGTGAQVIVTSYQFHCCGDITAWGTYVQPGGGAHRDGVYSINFQVWRPSPTVGSDGAGEYSLVGENRFPKLTLGSGGLVSETPQPTNVISVRPGDVVGYFQLSEILFDFNDDGIQLAADYSNARLLWYQTNAPQDTLSTLVAGNVGTLRSSTNAGPVLSLEISSSACPVPTPPPTAPPTAPLPTNLPTAPPTDPPTDLPIDLPTVPPTVSSTDPRTDLTTEPVTLQFPTTYEETSTSQPQDATATDQAMTIPVIVGVVVPTVLLLLIVVLAVILSLRRILGKKTVQTVHTATNNVVTLDASTVADIPMEIKTNECYGTTIPNDAIPVSKNDCYGTTAADFPLEVNECYSTSVPMQANQCYGTADNPLDRNTKMKASKSTVAMQSNESYGKLRETITAEHEYDYIARRAV